jgi:hypothetical protein
MTLYMRRYAERREQLVRLTKRQRQDLVHAAMPWSSAAHKLDGGIAALRASPFPPAAVAATAAAIMVWRPRTVLRWTRRVWFGLKLLQSLRR